MPRLFFKGQKPFVKSFSNKILLLCSSFLKHFGPFIHFLMNMNYILITDYFKIMKTDTEINPLTQKPFDWHIHIFLNTKFWIICTKIKASKHSIYSRWFLWMSLLNSGQRPYGTGYTTYCWHLKMYKHLRNKVKKLSLVLHALYKANEKISLEPPYPFPLLLLLSPTKVPLQKQVRIICL